MPFLSVWATRSGVHGTFALVDGANASGSYMQTGSTNIVNGWFRLGVNANSTGYYTLSNGVVDALFTGARGRGRRRGFDNQWRDVQRSDKAHFVSATETLGRGAWAH